MDLIHCTLTENVNSILKTGLFRNRPSLPNHIEGYKEVLDEDWDEKLLYCRCMTFNSVLNEKMIKDFIYWKIWGQPRNERLEEADNNDRYYDIDVSDTIIKRYCHFTLLELCVPEKIVHDYFYHVQTIDMNPYGKFDDMDIRYEHDDHILSVVHKGIVPREKIKIIGSGYSQVSRLNKINVSLNW